MTSSDYIDRVFGPDGYLALKFRDANPGIDYELREGQIELARKIHESFETGKHLIGEGPCGTGKSLSYSVPAVWHALRGRPHELDENQDHDARVIIATSNIALQEQLVQKDLPFLQSVLPRSFSFALLKGRNNFVCRDRFRENQARGRLPGADLFNNSFDDELTMLTDWIDGRTGTLFPQPTTTGDKTDLPFVPQPKNWNLVSIGSNDCKGSFCQFADECFSSQAKERAKTCDIIVTNFHMLFAHVMVKLATEGYGLVLPPFKFLIIDEAHDLADTARSFFGFDRGPGAVKDMVAALKKWGEREHGSELEQANAAFFDSIADYGRSDRYQGKLTAGILAEECDWIRFNSAIRTFAVHAEERLKIEEEDCANCEGKGLLSEKDILGRNETCSRCNGSGRVRIELEAGEKKKINTLISRALNVSADICEAVDCSKSPAKVYYVDAPHGKPPRICCRQIDVAELISAELMTETYSTVLVSATLSENRNFEFSKREIGLHLHKPIEFIAPTPFDFHNQALLVVPPGPNPNEREAFAQHCADAFENVVGYFQGRTLGLFTSYQNMRAVADRLRPIVSDLLVQGELPRTELRQQFKARPESVLLGTSSFWTGIDVPGESLSAVVIDKIPFPNRSDPVVAAIDDMDPNCFQNYMVPRAAIHLRQGAGRLIRSKSDTGVIVVLDQRLTAKRYGKRFLRSLPPMRITTSLDHIPLFMAEANQWQRRAV